MIAPGFGFTRDFLKERNNSAYCRLKKITCGFKEQARIRHPGEKCGLGTRPGVNGVLRITRGDRHFAEELFKFYFVGRS